MSGAILILIGLLLCLTGAWSVRSCGAGSRLRSLVAARRHLRRLDRHRPAHRGLWSPPRLPVEPGAVEADAVLRGRRRRRSRRRQAVRASRRQGRQRPARSDLHSDDRVPVRLPGAAMEPQLPGLGHGVRRCRDGADRSRPAGAGPARGAAGTRRHRQPPGVRRRLAGPGPAGQDPPGTAAGPGLGQQGPSRCPRAARRRERSVPRSPGCRG